MARDRRSAPNRARRGRRCEEQGAIANAIAVHTICGAAGEGDGSSPSVIAVATGDRGSRDRESRIVAW